MGDPPPLWGRPLNEYVASYQFEKTKQRGIFNIDPPTTLTREAADALSALGGARDGAGPSESALSIPVTIGNIQAVLRLIHYPRTYRHLAQPSAIGGCIKLMSSIKLDGKSSPFSYEYGYLCFRVLTIVLGRCLLHRSDKLDNCILGIEQDVRMSPQRDIIQLFSHYVSISLCMELSLKNQVQLDQILGWIIVERQPKQPPLVTIPDTELLFTILWDDRKMFFKALRSTYYPGISAVIFILWHLSCREQNPNKIKFQSTALTEITFRYNLISTSDQKRALDFINMDRGTTNRVITWERDMKQVDLEDCRQVIGTYINRFEPLNPTLYEPISVLDGPIILRTVALFVTQGTEDLLPTILQVTVKHIWDEIKNPSEPTKPDVYVDAIRDTIPNYATILRNRPVFGRINYDLSQGLVDTIVNYDLIDLVARGILMLDLASGPPAHEHAGSVDYLNRVQIFYAQLAAGTVPKKVLIRDLRAFISPVAQVSELSRLVPGDPAPRPCGSYTKSRSFGANIRGAMTRSEWAASSLLALPVMTAHIVVQFVDRWTGELEALGVRTQFYALRQRR
ncbi:unnamed protein product [Rhizoctonia solani]|uniref:Uncharacterized protein n=1 Tax=Rhizoctonia solani TaxID=456999 RepID=A0A8H3BUX5_9AGAM|nr:unnamed protein product [Rhizoctonia solani]